MFDERDLSADLDAMRTAHAPSAIVLDTERDFETLPPAIAESLGLYVESLSPASYPIEWLPADVPEQLRTYASSEFTVGMPGDGGVAWTRQTDPPVILVKPRLQGSPERFVAFLIAEAFVQLDTGMPEQFLPFFEDAYIDLDAAATLSPADTYQLAAALCEAHIGLSTREVFTDWADASPPLHDAWVDAGERLAPRVSDLPEALALGRTEFSDAAELACSAIKHGIEIPTPFGALDTDAYREYGPGYAVQWAEKTFEGLDAE
jgi:hypothetical protein